MSPGVGFFAKNLEIIHVPGYRIFSKSLKNCVSGTGFSKSFVPETVKCKAWVNKKNKRCTFALEIKHATFTTSKSCMFDF